MQEGLTLSQIDHMVVSVANLETSIKWYTTSFSCKVIYQTKTLAILQFENVKLVLSLPSDQRPHIAIVTENAVEFGEVTEQSDCCFSTFISDPTGNPVELIKIPFQE